MMFRQGKTPPADDPGVVRYIGQCTDDLPNVFPLPLRQAVHPTKVSSFDIGNGQRALLGDAIPNPAVNNAQISLYIPVGSRHTYTLSVFDLSGKKTNVAVPINEAGQVEISLPLGNLVSGVYAYSLQENGRPIGTRRLVVIK